MCRDMIIYIKNPKNSTKKFLHLINTFSKVAGYKTNAGISVTFQYSGDKQTEREIREAIPFTFASRNMFGVTLPKQVKDLNNRNFKTLKSMCPYYMLEHFLGICPGMV